MKTKVQPSVSSAIPRYGLSLSTVVEVSAHAADYVYLVDVMGLLTGMTAEREYVRDGKVTKMIVLELTDQTGKCECALFGDYVDEFQKMFGKVHDVMPVVVVQYAKVKVFRDKTSLQNVMNTTRILVNPDIDVVVAFKNGLSLHGLEASQPVPVLGPRAKLSMEDEFLRTYPIKTISDLVGAFGEGTFVVSGTVVGLVESEDWWYVECKCHKSVTADSGAHYCGRCDKHVFQTVPRFKVKMNVTDGTGDAIFVLFDGDVHYLTGENCVTLVSAARAKNAGCYPSQLLALEGTRVLFKVEKSASPLVSLDGSFKVKRVCVDPAIIKSFDLIGSDGDVPQGFDKCSLASLDALSQTGSDWLALVLIRLSLARLLSLKSLPLIPSVLLILVLLIRNHLLLLIPKLLSLILMIF